MALPKNKRKLLAPMPDKVQALVQRLLQPNTYRQGRLLSVLATLLRDLYRVQVAIEDWDQQRLPEHLRLFCKVVDDEGKVLASGRDLQALKDRLKGQTSAIPADFSEYQQTNIQALPISLPDHVVVQTSAGPTMGFRDSAMSHPAIGPRSTTKHRCRSRWTSLCLLRLKSGMPLLVLALLNWR